MENIVVVKPNFEKIKNKIISEWSENLIIFSDLDFTLTKAFHDWKKIGSIISQIRDWAYISSDYSQEAKKLYATYQPILDDTSLEQSFRYDKMTERWTKHFDLLIQCGLDQKVMDKIVEERPLYFREKIKDFVTILKNKDIPLVIISASVGYMIEAYMKKENLLSKNTHIVANFFDYNEEWKVVWVKEPIVHSLNKDATVLHDFYTLDHHRKNVILLGDTIGDVDMVNGYSYDNILKIGFCNDEKNREEYKKYFDVVILNDWDMEFIKELLDTIKGV